MIDTTPNEFYIAVFSIFPTMICYKYTTSSFHDLHLPLTFLHKQPPYIWVGFTVIYKVFSSVSHNASASMAFIHFNHVTFMQWLTSSSTSPFLMSHRPKALENLCWLYYLLAYNNQQSHHLQKHQLHLQQQWISKASQLRTTSPHLNHVKSENASN